MQLSLYDRKRSSRKAASENLYTNPSRTAARNVFLSIALCAWSGRPTIAVLAAPNFLISSRSMQTPYAKRHANNVIGGGEVHHRCLVLERFRAPSSPRIDRCPPKPHFPSANLAVESTRARSGLPLLHGLVASAALIAAKYDRDATSTVHFLFPFVSCGWRPNGKLARLLQRRHSIFRQPNHVGDGCADKEDLPIRE